MEFSVRVRSARPIIHFKAVIFITDDNDKVKLSELFEPPEEEQSEKEWNMAVARQYFKKLDEEDGGWEGPIVKE